MPRTKARQRRSGEQFGDYVVEITGWSWDYHCSAGGLRWERDPLFEVRTIDVEGRVLAPRSANCERARISLFPRADLVLAERLVAGPGSIKAVGHLEKRGPMLGGFVDFPADAFGPLISMFAAKRFAVLLMHGPKLFRQKAEVRSFRLAMKHDPDEYLEDYATA